MIQDKKEKKEEHGDVAGSILRGLGDIIPGLGGLIKGLEKTDSFRERLETINKEVDRKLGKEPLKRVGERIPHIRTNFTTRTLAKDRSPFKKKVEEQESQKTKEPLVDVFDEKDCIMVIAELPGVEEKDIKVDLKGDKLTITVDAVNRKYYKEVGLPCLAEGSEVEKIYRNGILEIKVRKQD